MHEGDYEADVPEDALRENHQAGFHADTPEPECDLCHPPALPQAEALDPTVAAHVRFFQRRLVDVRARAAWAGLTEDERQAVLKVIDDGPGDIG